jgi:hypothetical protein
MGEFVRAALGFPAVLFSFSLIVVVAYWALVLLGGAGLDILDGDEAGETGHAAGPLAGLGLGGVPASVAVSLLIALAWFGSLAGTALLGGDPPAALRAAVLVAAPACAWLGTRALVVPLRRFFTVHRSPSRHDFVGSICVIRTGRVGPDFGQAEVRSPDGSSAVIQVRQSQSQWPGHAPREGLGAEPGSRDGTGLEPSPGERRGQERALRAGDTALIFDYDARGEFFHVMPYDAGLGPDALTI